MKLHNIITSPAMKVIAYILLLAITIVGLLAVREFKQPVREAGGRTVRKAQDYIYSREIKMFGDRNKESLPEAKAEIKPEVREEKSSDDPEWVKAPQPATRQQNVPQTRRVGQRPVQRQVQRTVRRTVAPEVVLPLCLYAKASDSGTTTVADDIDIAPYGRLLRCELANTISTASNQTPIIALVTEALWWDGVEIIPAGVEVHGTVSGMTGGRIGTGSSWKVVYPFRDDRSAFQLDLTGIALDCNRTETNWGKSDGSYGIRGRLISNADQAQMAAVFAKFISGVGSGMVSQRNDYIGGSTISTTGGTWKDSIGSGLKDAFQQVAKNYLDAAAKEVAYIEAEAGTEFYIYVQQIIDPAKAARGKMTAENNKLTRPENLSGSSRIPAAILPSGGRK